MASIGEGELIVESTTIGRFRFLNVFALPSVYPRLGFSVEWELGDLPDVSGRRGRVTSFEMTYLNGELFLSDHGQCFGPIYWAGPHCHVRSTVRPAKGQIQVAIDLTPMSLSRIEDSRGGAAPNFWVQLWPTPSASEPNLGPHVHAFRIEIPRDQWLKCLSEIRPMGYEILEVWSPPDLGGEFEAATKRIREARSRVDSGDFDGAMASCRKALEAIASSSVDGGKRSRLTQALEGRVGKIIQKKYSEIQSTLYSLTSIALHDTPVEYRRADVVSIIRMTEILISLFSVLAITRPGES